MKDMCASLVPGQNCVLPGGILQIELKSGASADFSAYQLYADDKTRKDSDFIFYGQKSTPEGAIALVTGTNSAIFTVDLPRLDMDAQKIAFAVTSEFPSIASLNKISLDIVHEGTKIVSCVVDAVEHEEAALILGQIYRRKNEWKFRFIAQGFRGGLKPLAEMYGVDIADDAPAREARSEPAVNLSKIVLSKTSPRIDLNKHEAAKGLIRVNLNWHATGKERPKGLAALFSRGNGVDLDLAAYVRLKNGEQTIVQALGERFGSLEQPPFVKLMGDDRTGSDADGEWIYIGADKIDKIDEVLIFTFIYSGVPNWQATDAVVKIWIQGQPEIETRLTEGDNNLPMCAIARIVNTGGKLRIERINRYFQAHQSMDEAFGWGFRWVAGRK